jgi:polyhydroxyalkanoate synthesis regulator phasin
MQDALRTYLAMANGLTEVSRKGARAAAKKLAKQGGGAVEQVQALTEELLSTSRANRESITTLVRYEVDRALGLVGLATVEEVENLTARIHELEAQLRSARHDAATGGAGDEETAREARVAAAEARAEAAAVKKAAPRKTAARKTTARKAAPAALPAPERSDDGVVANPAKGLPETSAGPETAAAPTTAAAAPVTAAPAPPTAAPQKTVTKRTATKRAATKQTGTGQTGTGQTATKAPAKRAPRKTAAKRAPSPQAIATTPASREVEAQVAEVQAAKVAKLPATNPATATSESGGTEL